MNESNAPTQYWFDAAPLTAVPKRRTAAEALGSVLPGKQHTDRQQEALVAFAAANDLHYISWVTPQERTEPRPSLVLDDTCMTVVMGPRPHLLEIGNHGWRFWKSEDDRSPSRRGYIAIRHGLGLPSMYLDSHGPGAATLLAAASAVVNVAGFFDVERTTPGTTPLDAFRERAVRLDLPSASDFTAYVDGGAPPERRTKLGRKARERAEADAATAAALSEGRVAEATALLSGPAAPLLAELAASFDIEVGPDWLFAYCTYGELSTLDPEIWAWGFGSASRLFDVLAVWGADTADARQQAWYTPEQIARPGKVEGALQSLVPKRGGRLGGLRFGRGER